MNLTEANKLLKQIDKQKWELIRARPCSQKESSYFMQMFNLVVDDKINYEYVNGRLSPEDPEILVHNVNHFRLATEERRFLPEFGLGAPPNSKYYESYDEFNDPLLLISKEEAQKEESLVLTLDLICSIAHGYSLNQVSAIPTAKDLRTLYALGIITKDGKLTNKVRL